MSTVSVIGAPYTQGADFDTHEHVSQGPDAIRDEGLLTKLENRGIPVTDTGNISQDQDPVGNVPDGVPEETAAFSTAVANTAAEDHRRGNTPLVLGGDHAAAIGAVKAASMTHDTLGLVWLDAHADFNTPESSPTGNFHGMPVAALLGHDPFNEYEWMHAQNLAEENTVLVGLREVDAVEWKLLEDSNVSVYTMKDIVEDGVLSVLRDAFDTALNGSDAVHTSLDMDWYDPRFAPGVGTPAPGGVSYREGLAACQDIYEKYREDMVSVDVCEVNPAEDEMGRTALLAALSATVLLAGDAYSIYYD